MMSGSTLESRRLRTKESHAAPEPRVADPLPIPWYSALCTAGVQLRVGRGGQNTGGRFFNFFFEILGCAIYFTYTGTAFRLAIGSGSRGERHYCTLYSRVDIKRTRGMIYQAM